MIDGLDLQALAREIAARMDPVALMDAEDVGAMLKCCPRQVTERFAKQKDFPKAVRLATEPGARAKLRWQRADISAWISARKVDPSNKGGRPRKVIV